MFVFRNGNSPKIAFDILKPIISEVVFYMRAKANELEQLIKIC